MSKNIGANIADDIHQKLGLFDLLIKYKDIIAFPVKKYPTLFIKLFPMEQSFFV